MSQSGLSGKSVSSVYPNSVVNQFFKGILLFFNPQITEKLFVENQEITESAPNYLVEDFKNFKENTIFKKKGRVNENGFQQITDYF